MLYKPSRVSVPEKFHEKIKQSLNQGGKVSVKINIEQSEGGRGGNETLLLTRGQLKKIDRARENGKKNITIRFSRRQVEANVKHEGGFLGMLASLAATVIPGILAGVVSGAIEKAVSGNGLYLHKRGKCARVQLVKGGGLYLSPHPVQVDGNGLYLKHGKDIYGQNLVSQSPWIKSEVPIMELII